jgi:hypothetical protein
LTGLSDSSLPALYLLHIHFVLIIIYMEKEAGEGQSHMPEEGGPVSEQVDKNLTGKKSLNTKLLVGGSAAIVVVLVILGTALLKKPKSNYIAGDSSGQSQQAIQSPSIDQAAKNNNQQTAQCCAVLPFKNNIKADGYLYATVNGQDFPTEFTSWGGHSLPMAGGHVEGNNKSNFRIHIQPQGKTVALNDGSLGVTLADAQANAPWYTAENDGMKLIALEHLTNQDTSPYLSGEGTQWRLYFSFAGGLDLNLQHTGEISPELLKLITDSGQASILSVTQYTKLTTPVSVALGTRLARPQLINVQSAKVSGATIYQVDAQTEWSITPTMVTTKSQACQWNYFSKATQTQMQSVLDTELTKPISHGLFSGTASSAGVGVEAAAEGSLCASDSIAYDNYSALSANYSFGFYKVTDATKPTGDVFSVYKTDKNSAAYKANTASYASSAVDFMFRRGKDISGFSDTSKFQFQLSEGAKTYTLHELSGEVVDMPTAVDTATNDHFTVKIDRGDNGVGAATMPIGKYLGVRYKIESNRVVVSWGTLADTAASVVVPATIPAGATCDGQVYSCYIHDFSLFK